MRISRKSRRPSAYLAWKLADVIRVNFGVGLGVGLGEVTGEGGLVVEGKAVGVLVVVT